ncbi:hypothetical protein [Armatimonas sp.]|uniref:phosphorylase family protein n=1 Tax=Armatimonas sp. TaxID=1872638 RepID=UPI00374D2641
MRLFVCAATAWELSAWGEVHESEEQESITLQVTGVGAPATFAALSQRPEADLILAIGIAGAYRETGLEIGELVIGESEAWGDIGFALPEPPHFRPIQQSEFGGFYSQPQPLWAPAWLPAKRGRGCTVHTCTGTEEQGALRRELFSAHFESMEGAAVAQLGQSWGIPVCEVRAISNMAAHRDMRPEHLSLAKERLTMFLKNLKSEGDFFHRLSMELFRGESPS